MTDTADGHWAAPIAHNYWTLKYFSSGDYHARVYGSACGKNLRPGGWRSFCRTKEKPIMLSF